MYASVYYKTLGIPEGSSLEDIKKAYRKKARLYHPDINPSPEAIDKFISATEAYEFLKENYNKTLTDEEIFFRAMEEWRKYRQARARQRARFYAEKSYSNFKSSNFYKSTRILNGSSIIFNFSVAVMVLIYTIAGYIIRIKDPDPLAEKPSLLSFALLLVLSLILFTVSFIYLKAFIHTRRRNKEIKDDSRTTTSEC